MPFDSTYDDGDDAILIILENSRATIQDGWAKRSYVGRIDGKYRYCLVAAYRNEYNKYYRNARLNSASVAADVHVADGIIGRLLLDQLPAIWQLDLGSTIAERLITFNDAPLRRKQRIVKLFDSTIAAYIAAKYATQPRLELIETD